MISSAKNLSAFDVVKTRKNITEPLMTLHMKVFGLKWFQRIQKCVNGWRRIRLFQ